jgi:hypothetical protein
MITKRHVGYLVGDGRALGEILSATGSAVPAWQKVGSFEKE